MSSFPPAEVPPTPPPLPVPPPIPAPVDAAPLETAANTELSAALKISVIAVGALQLLLAFIASGMGRGAANISFRIGSVIGATAFWPLIVIGFFSIAPRFRTARTRAIILLVLWGLAILGHMGSISRAARSAALRALDAQTKIAPEEKTRRQRRLR
jgi:hypothetical protein